MRRAAIYTFIETAKLTRIEAVPLKLVDQAALVRDPPPWWVSPGGHFFAGWIGIVPTSSIVRAGCIV
jgi:hypothetical protein